MIYYQCQDIEFKLKEKQLNNKWLKLVAESEIKKIGDITIVFCSDNFILDTNIRFLGHDFFTDIITFDYCEGSIMSGDLIISIDSVRENAVTYGSTFEEELDRVMVHGLLHLIGYDDHTEEQQKFMRQKENYYISVKNSLRG